MSDTQPGEGTSRRPARLWRDLRDSVRGVQVDYTRERLGRAILLLSRSEYARKARYGYCRGSEPVNYIREISARYKAYREATGDRS